MRRRQVLAVLTGVLGATGGCLGRENVLGSPTESANPSSRTPTITPTPTASRTPTCADGSVYTLEIPSCPTRPDPLTTENALEYAKSFEEAYRTRKLLEEEQYDYAYIHYKNYSGISHGTKPTVESGDDGVSVSFRVDFGFGYHQESSCLSTPVVVHGDYPYDVGYLFDSASVWRVERKPDDAPLPAPREAGERVTCSTPE